MLKSGTESLFRREGSVVQHFTNGEIGVNPFFITLLGSGEDFVDGLKQLIYWKRLMQGGPSA
jgi:hypothetical protein